MNRVLLSIIAFVLGVILHKPAEDIFAWTVEKLKSYFDKSNKVKDAVTEAAEDVKDAAVDAAKTVQEKAEEVINGTVNAAKDAAAQVSETLQQGDKN